MHSPVSRFSYFGCILFLLLTPFCSEAQDLNAKCNQLETAVSIRQHLPDWLINPSSYKAKICKGELKGELILTNGLVERHFRIQPDLVCFSFKNLTNGEELIRSLKPEVTLTLDGNNVSAGGLLGQFEHGYLEYNWLDSFIADETGFRLIDFTVGDIKARLNWTPRRWVPQFTWPPKGKEIIFLMQSLQYKDIDLEIHYEIYDGIPLISKWFVLKNKATSSILLNDYINENLAVVEPVTTVENIKNWDVPNMLVCSDYAFCGMNTKSSNQTANWVRDSVYTSQVDYGMNTPCQLVCRLPHGPMQEISAGTTFESNRIYELIFDSFDPERKGLSVRKMYRILAPWALENPIFLHLTSTDPDVMKTAVDQCVDMGFEMIILSFGSGLSMESTDAANLAKFREAVAYANGKGIELGGYSLLASRRINDKEDVINPVTGKTGGAIFGNSPCLESQWGIDYFKHLKTFFDSTGFALLEHDGSYPGDVCASTSHPGHKGLRDSQWTQWKAITDFYAWCRARDIYLNVPDWYFLTGSNKTGIGYRETNWSLPRDRQIMLGRQNLYDGTWEKTPSMGWTFVPLVEYQGGGEAATLEPLSQHLPEYKAHLAQNFGAGVQACYRGSRLYDTDLTRQLVSSWVSWYKRHREILNSDIIHLRRPDGRDWDGFLHVNPELKEKGLLMVFNPLDTPIDRKIRIPLYYTGIQREARVIADNGTMANFLLNHQKEATLDISIPAKGLRWFVIE